MATPQIVLALNSGALSEGARVVVLAPCLAEALRGTPRDASANRIIAAVGAVAPLTEKAARRAGEILGRHKSSDTVDAMVVAIAIENGATDVMTSDPEDLERLGGGHFNIVAI